MYRSMVLMNKETRHTGYRALNVYKMKEYLVTTIDEIERSRIDL